jgi:aldose sugar dehydrogenase
MIRYPACMLAAAALASPLFAQTARERAVAIDRIEAPVAENFAIDAIGPALQFPWSLALLPNGSFLISEKHRGLVLISAQGGLTRIESGLPQGVLTKEDSGFLDLALDPDFASNRTVYLAYAEGSEAANRTAIWKAKLDGNRLTGGRTIFRVNAAKKGPSHPGGRLLFLPDKTLLLSVGDGYDYRDAAQNPASHLGKLLRLTREGAVPPDNPFIGKAGHAPEVWSLGHRNIQGLIRDPATGLVWSHEHGPRGGDEVNQLAPGKNYGWPRALFGIDYDGKRISDRLHVDGAEGPLFFWSPSIAPSGLAVYHGSKFPEWEGKLLVGGLAARGLIVLRPGKETGLLIEEARLLSQHKWRIRDVRVGENGTVYLLTDEEQGRLLRLTPAAPPPTSLPGDHPLAPIAFLVGKWSGESRLRPLKDRGAREIAETSSTDCALIHGALHLRCTTRFVRGDGKARVVEQTFSQGSAGLPVEATVVGDRWAGQSLNRFVRRAADGTLVAEVPFEEDGRKHVERITLTPAADGRSLIHTEESRPVESGEWFETFRWTLRRKD